MEENTIILRNNSRLSYLPNTSQSVDEISDIHVFLDNLDLILKCQDKIFSDSELFFIPVKFYGSACYIEVCPDNYITALGNYLEAWQYDPETTASCPTCNSKSYIFAFSGSPLSGSHSFNAYCVNCKKSFKGCKEHFYDLRGPFSEQLKRYPSYKNIKHSSLIEFINNNK